MTELSQNEQMSVNGEPLALRRMTARQPLSVRIIDNVWEFSSLRDEWNTIAEASYATAFQSHEWLSRWWKHFGSHPSCRLQIVLFTRGERIVGIAPLFLESTTLGGHELHRTLKLMGSGTHRRLAHCMPTGYGPSDYLDIIARLEDEYEVAEAFVRFLNDHHQSYDQAEFSNAPQDSILIKRVLPLLHSTGMRCSAERDEVCPRLAVPASMDEYLASRDSGTRHRLNQARKAAGPGKTFTIEAIKDEAEFEEFFQALIALHQQRWNRLGYPGLFSNPWFEDFQREAALEFLHTGNLWCKVARASGVIVAARMAFRFNNCYYDYLSGFDDRAPAAKRRPGLALLLSMIDDAVNDSMSVVDFLRGDEQYKFELTDEAVYNWTIRIENPWTATLPRTRIFQALHAWQEVRHRVESEAVLVDVHFREHGIIHALPRYAAFRWNRASERFPALKQIASASAATLRTLFGRIKALFGAPKTAPSGVTIVPIPTNAPNMAGKGSQKKHQQLVEAL